MKQRVAHRNGRAHAPAPPPSPQQRALAHGLQLHQAGRLPDAEAVYRQVLAADPANHQALGLLGALANQVGQHAAAVELISQAVRIEPTAASYHSNLGVAYQNLGQLQEAVECYRRALALQPDHVDALNNVAIALQALGRLPEALESFERSLKLRPNHAQTLNNVGALYLVLGRLDEAEMRLRRSLKLQPGYAEALISLAGVQLTRGHVADALASCALAVKNAPADPRAHDMLGTALRAAGRPDEAIGSYRRALAHNPAPQNAASIWLNLAGTLQVAGRSVEAADAYRQTLALSPGNAVAHSGLIFALDLLPGHADEAHAERQRYDARFGQAWRDRPSGHRNDRDPARRLRVGYVSADFYHHSAASIFMPILRSHDRSQVALYCYSGATERDALNAEARALADVWHDVAYLSDDALEAQIRADEIDILVDLSGHSAGNRLPVFARKPAPVQVTAWGYAAGTGLPAMGHFLADPICVPPEAYATYAEQVVDLPGILCYDPAPYAPPVSPSPARARGYVTFGAFNRLPKVSEETLAAWGRVLHAVPTARLVIKASGADTSPGRERLLERLEAHGVAAERVTLLGLTQHEVHLAAHGEIDIMLDTFPQSGGVTTLDAMLMGVPVVTLLCERVPGRASASFLTTVGLGDLAADSADEYVEIAARLAGDLDRLARERASLRGRLLASPIGDVRAYTRHVEAAYRRLWQAWCGEPAAGGE
jgi:predicted O-linked N-acetylglucosamine transferase (SPINDLY family)